MITDLPTGGKPMVLVAMVILVGAFLRCDKQKPAGTVDDGGTGDGAQRDSASDDAAAYADGAPSDAAFTDGTLQDAAHHDGGPHPDGAGDDGGTAAYVLCGWGMCSVPAEVCCATQVGQNYQYDCVTAGTCTGLGWAACDESDDCPPSEFCCFTSGPNNAVCVSSTCGEQQVCVNATDCPGSHPYCCIMGAGVWGPMSHCSADPC